MPVRAVSGVDHTRGSVRIRKVSGDVLDLSPLATELLDQGLRPAWVSPPRLLGVMSRPRMHQHSGAVSHQAPDDGGADRDPTTGAGHQHHPSL